jgi:dTDP-4-amino-4,6-dideoxygalactose transaminase
MGGKMQPLFKVFTPEESIASEIDKILKSGQLTSGNNVRLFEKQLQEYIGNPYVLVTGSNTYASLIALALCGLKNKDEVIASPMACLASNQPVLNFGAKLVWADIDPLTGTLDPGDVRKRITSKTKAILHYHWGGYPGYIDEINKIGLEFGIPVIDDAIESFGAEYKGRKMGNTQTPITTFSFQTVRLPNSVDGGALAFNDEATYQKALRMRDFGINRSTFRDELNEISSSSDISHLGYNAIMNEINALVGNKVMEHTPDLIAKQRTNAAKWDVFCAEQGYQPLNSREEITPNYWIYSFLTPNQKQDLISIRESGYYASKVHIRNDYYSCFGEFDTNLPGVTTFAEQQLAVPSGWWVNK